MKKIASGKRKRKENGMKSKDKLEQSAGKSFVVRGDISLCGYNRPSADTCG